MALPRPPPDRTTRRQDHDPAPGSASLRPASPTRRPRLAIAEAPPAQVEFPLKNPEARSEAQTVNANPRAAAIGNCRPAETPAFRTAGSAPSNSLRRAEPPGPAEEQAHPAAPEAWARPAASAARVSRSASTEEGARSASPARSQGQWAPAWRPARPSRRAKTIPEEEESHWAEPTPDPAQPEAAPRPPPGRAPSPRPGKPGSRPPKRRSGCTRRLRAPSGPPQTRRRRLRPEWPEGRSQWRRTALRLGRGLRTSARASRAQAARREWRRTRRRRPGSGR